MPKGNDPLASRVDPRGGGADDRSFVSDLRQDVVTSQPGAGQPASSGPSLGSTLAGVGHLARAHARWLGLAACVLLLLGGGAFAATRFLGGSDEPAPTTAAQSKATQGPADARAAQGEQERGGILHAAKDKLAGGAKAVGSAVGTGARKVTGGVKGAVNAVSEKASEITGRGEAKEKAAKAKAGKQRPTAKQPAPAKPKAGKARAAPRPLVGERKVAWGDSMRAIAQREYGDERLWPLIWDYNKARAKQSGMTMTNPDLIYPGWNLVIPGETKAKPVKPTPAKVKPAKPAEVKSTRPQPAKTKAPTATTPKPTRAKPATAKPVKAAPPKPKATPTPKKRAKTAPKKPKAPKATPTPKPATRKQ